MQGGGLESSLERIEHSLFNWEIPQRDLTKSVHYAAINHSPFRKLPAPSLLTRFGLPNSQA